MLEPLAQMLIGAFTRSCEPALGVWQRMDAPVGSGAQELKSAILNTARTIIDSPDPIAVVETVPWGQTSMLSVAILVLSLIVLAVAVMLWPLFWLSRRNLTPSPDDLKNARQQSALWWVLRMAALFDLLWLLAWCAALRPGFGAQLGARGVPIDGVLRVLQVGGIIALAAACFCLYSLWAFGRWPARLAAAVVALALAGVAAVAAHAGLTPFTVDS